jgi:hypothetical protein
MGREIDLSERASINDLMVGGSNMSTDLKKQLIYHFCGTLAPFVQTHPLRTENFYGEKYVIKR